MQTATFLLVREPLLLVTRRDTLAVRHNPDLQEVHWFCLRVIELAVADTRTRGHDLHFARSDDRSGADAVLVLEGTFQNVGNDFHVPMSVSTESLSGADPVFVDHPERPEAHVLRIVIVTEGKRVPAIKPSQIGGAATTGFANGQHDERRYPNGV